MKKSTIITSLSFAAALLVMGTSTALAEISPDQAKEIALKHAGVNPNEATMLKIEKILTTASPNTKLSFGKTARNTITQSMLTQVKSLKTNKK